MDKGRQILFFATLFIIVAIVAVFLCWGPQDEDHDVRSIIAQLEKKGLLVEPVLLEQTEVKIPRPLDEIYLTYNTLQKEAGYDLAPYQGKTVRRYTFQLTGEFSEEVRVNVLWYRSRIVGGDIMSTALDGKMTSLNDGRSWEE